MTGSGPRHGRTQHVVVVGGGIIGLAVARRLLQTRPGRMVTVLEKEQALAQHQSRRNSGVVHAGLYYPPGSLKARLCRRGVSLLRTFCDEHGIAYEECGKVVVALDRDERTRLDEIQRRAEANGVPGLRRLGPDGLRAVEPQAAGVEALHSPHTAIADFAGVCRALAGEIVAAGGQVVTRAEVTSVVRRGSRVRIATNRPGHDVIEADLAVACAGLHSDRLAVMAGERSDPRVLPFRGEYHLLRPAARSLVRGLIYPVPDPRYPFLGIHLTRRWDGEVLVGPNAVLALAREGYRRRDVDPRELTAIVGYPGFRALVRQHWRTGLRELHRSASRRAFVNEARRYVPALRADMVTPGPAGVRAQALALDGGLVDDFVIDGGHPVVHLRNAPSPGATSSLAIAEHVVALLDLP